MKEKYYFYKVISCPFPHRWAVHVAVYEVTAGVKETVERGNLVVKLFSFSILPLLSVFALFHAIRFLFLFLRNPRSPYNLINHDLGTSAGHRLEQFRIQVRKSLIFYVLSASLYKTSPSLRPNLLDLSTVSDPPSHPSLSSAPLGILIDLRARLTVTYAN